MTERGTQAGATTPPTIDANLLVQAMQLWTQGQQDAAVAQLQPPADQGDPVASFVMAWCLHQMGERWREAIPYAQRAINGGYAQAASYVVGNMISDPSLMPQALSLARQAAQQGVVVLDPAGQLISTAQQGDVAAVQQMLETPWPSPHPNSDEYWASLVATAESTTERVNGMLSELTTGREQVLDEIEQARTQVRQSESRAKEATSELLELINELSNAESTTFFEAETTTSEKSANDTWKWGVGVVIFAAALGLLPLVIHYVRLIATGNGPLGATQVLAAHATATLALATVAGVLLTRSRVRDRNRQRHRDLSVALKTMFAYGAQMENPEDRRAFIQNMGTTIIEAFLNHGSSAEDNPGGGGLLPPATPAAPAAPGLSPTA